VLRLGRLLAVLALVSLAVATPSRADGDPASDVLLAQNVYFPYQPPAEPLRAALDAVVNAVYAHGDRVKVALIYSVEDLGAIPELFDKPKDYARFLGLELRYFYAGPLIIVMPAGWGVYDGGRATTSMEQILRSVPVDGASPDDLTRAATTALQRLVAAGALKSTDITSPIVTAFPAVATRGKPARLRYDVYDDSGRSKERVRVYSRSTLLATLTSSHGFQAGTRHVALVWRVPRLLPGRKLRFCIVATDPAGNRSAPTCAPFIRVA
jgi:hypothetical protein